MGKIFKNYAVERVFSEHTIRNQKEHLMNKFIIDPEVRAGYGFAPHSVVMLDATIININRFCVVQAKLRDSSRDHIIVEEFEPHRELLKKDRETIKKFLGKLQPKQQYEIIVLNPIGIGGKVGMIPVLTAIANAICDLLKIPADVKRLKCALRAVKPEETTPEIYDILTDLSLDGRMRLLEGETPNIREMATLFNHYDLWFLKTNLYDHDKFTPTVLPKSGWVNEVKISLMSSDENAVPKLFATFSKNGYDICKLLGSSNYAEETREVLEYSQNHTYSRYIKAFEFQFGGVLMLSAKNAMSRMTGMARTLADVCPEVTSVTLDKLSIVKSTVDIEKLEMLYIPDQETYEFKFERVDRCE